MGVRLQLDSRRTHGYHTVTTHVLGHVLTDIVPSRRMYWDDFMGELLDSDEIEKAWKLEIEYFRKMGVCKKAPIQEAQEGGHRVHGV